MRWCSCWTVSNWTSGDVGDLNWPIMLLAVTSNYALFGEYNMYY